MGGERERGDHKEVRFVVVLLGGDIYRIHALLWILLFDFYMILYSRQIVYLNKYPVVRLSFDRRASILHNWVLSTC